MAHFFDASDLKLSRELRQNAVRNYLHIKCMRHLFLNSHAFREIQDRDLSVTLHRIVFEDISWNSLFKMLPHQNSNRSLHRADFNAALWFVDQTDNLFTFENTRDSTS